MSWIGHPWGDCPPPLGGHASVRLGSYVLVLGGNGLGAAQQMRCWLLDTDTQCWLALKGIKGDAPCPRFGHCAVASGNRVVVFGGVSLATTDVLEDMYILETDKNVDEWAWRVPSVQGNASPSRRYGHSLVKAHNKLLLFGGQNTEQCFGDLWQLELSPEGAQVAWSQLQTHGSPPSPRAYHGAEVVKGRFMAMFGGRTLMEGNQPAALNDLYVLDAKRLKWKNPSCIGMVPPPRYNHDMALVDDLLYVFGGASPVRGKCLNDLAVLSTKSMTWHFPALPGDAPTARSRHSMVAVGSNIWIFGGTDGKGWLNDLTTLQLRPVFWREIEACHQEIQLLKGVGLADLPADKLAALKRTYEQGLQAIAALQASRGPMRGLVSQPDAMSLSSSSSPPVSASALDSGPIEGSKMILPPSARSPSPSSRIPPPAMGGEGFVGGDKPIPPSAVHFHSPQARTLPTSFTLGPNGPLPSMASVITRPGAAPTEDTFQSAGPLDSPIGPTSILRSPSNPRRRKSTGTSQAPRVQFGSVKLRFHRRRGEERSTGPSIGLGWSVVKEEHRNLVGLINL